MITARLNWGLAVGFVLSWACPGLAQSTFSGSYELEGDYYTTRALRLNAEARLTITSLPGGSLEVTREGRYTSHVSGTVGPFVWTSTTTYFGSGGNLVVVYELSTVGGLSGVISAAGSGAARNFLVGVYTRTPQGLREYVRNFTRQGDESFWRSLQTSGHQAAPTAQGLHDLLGPSLAADTPVADALDAIAGVEDPTHTSHLLSSSVLGSPSDVEQQSSDDLAVSLLPAGNGEQAVERFLARVRGPLGWEPDHEFHEEVRPLREWVETLGGALLPVSQFQSVLFLEGTQQHPGWSRRFSVLLVQDRTGDWYRLVLAVGRQS